MRTLDMRCPGCGAAVTTSTECCDFCGRVVVVTSFSNLVGMGLRDLDDYRALYSKTLQEQSQPHLTTALAIVHLKLGLFPEARESLAAAMRSHPDNAEVHFYAAAAALDGKRPFVAGKAAVTESERFLQAATRLEERGLFYWMHAFLAYDYFERKYLNHEPGFVALAALAEKSGVSTIDKSTLADVLSVDSVDLPVSI